MNKKKIISFIIAVFVSFTSVPVAANVEQENETIVQTTHSINTISASADLVYQLNKASIMLGNGTISEEEYAVILIDIYNLDNNIINKENVLKRASSSYYPEVQCGYINYSGVKYLYKTGLKKAKTASGAISLLISAIPGCGWGLSAVAVASSYGGYSSLEKAVHKAYSKKKGIKVYYKIHKAVTSMNKVRYVVG
ncbi:hypothetical protein [Anaerostipes sp.]|uniref:hypothetical protein n=1 Tax=Anaerostipes sp. TaxID=1872530 RepID=UPI002585739C|nr:hypothetical protein [Anaerostipes sp.]MCI5622624.1 hypothetical protein [Anaerostipes sp.]